MFWFFKKIDEKNIKSFSQAIRAIKVFSSLSEWEKARKASFEVLKKEKDSFDIFFEKKDISDAKKQKAKEIFEKREKQIKKLILEINNKEKVYLENEKIQRFKARFKIIKSEINKNISKWNTKEALDILEKFFLENKDKIEVLNFYKKQKNTIEKILNKRLWILENKLKSSPKLEAMSLIWEKINEKEFDKTEKNWKKSILKKFYSFFWLLRKIKEKKLLDEINILLEEDDKIKKEIAQKKLEKLQENFKKEIFVENMIWYDFYWKIDSENKNLENIFWFKEQKDDYFFFFWKSTSKEEKWSFVISIFENIFKTIRKIDFRELFFEINNKIKQKLESRAFVSWAFFHINKTKMQIQAVGMWKNIILIYKARTWEIINKKLWWIASWVRIFQNLKQINIKNLFLEKDDIMIAFSSELWENTLEILIENLKKINPKENLKNIYDFLYEKIKLSLEKDIWFIFLRRNKEKDLIKRWDLFLEELQKENFILKDKIKNFEWKRKKDIKKELEEIKKKQEIKNIIQELKELYFSWEILLLKKEATYAIRRWLIHKDINYYLKKAFENENSYKIKRKDERMQNKYNILLWLYKRWDYETVIKEIEYIILKDWNI